MLLSLPELVEKYQMDVIGVLHVGAHLVEEAPLYDTLAMGDVCWVEANPGVLDTIEARLEKYPQQRLVHGLVYSKSHVNLPFHVTNYDGMSSSILEFGTHTSFSPDTVFQHTISLATTTIDDIVARHRVVANFLNMDLQGAELHALQGGLEFLCQQVDYVMTEVNDDEVYVGCARIEQIDELLQGNGFERVETYWVPDQGWGDAFYVRRSTPPLGPLQ